MRAIVFKTLKIDRREFLAAVSKKSDSVSFNISFNTVLCASDADFCNTMEKYLNGETVRFIGEHHFKAIEIDANKAKKIYELMNAIYETSREKVSTSKFNMNAHIEILKTLFENFDLKKINLAIGRLSNVRVISDVAA